MFHIAWSHLFCLLLHTCIQFTKLGAVKMLFSLYTIEIFMKILVPSHHLSKVKDISIRGQLIHLVSCQGFIFSLIRLQNIILFNFLFYMFLLVTTSPSIRSFIGSLLMIFLFLLSYLAFFLSFYYELFLIN